MGGNINLPFEFERLEIPDIILIKPKKFIDPRGFLAELYKRTDYLSNSIPYDFVQMNISMSMKGVIRGLHYQVKPYEQGKLIIVLSGKIYDVAIDIRDNSPHYLKHVATELSSDELNLLWIPPGFAHGFQALENNTLVLYLLTKEYSPAHERCIKWNDPVLSIKWPIKEAIVSEKDQKCPEISTGGFKSNFKYDFLNTIFRI